MIKNHENRKNRKFNTVYIFVFLEEKHNMTITKKSAQVKKVESMNGKQKNTEIKRLNISTGK